MSAIRTAILLNAIANLGYADCRFLKPVYPGDTLTLTSEVIGLKENSNPAHLQRRVRNQSAFPTPCYVSVAFILPEPVLSSPHRTERDTKSTA
jgi:acyl dehydratase